MVLAALASWWVRNEMVKERRRRELVAASNERTAKLAVSRGNNTTEVAQWNRIFASYLLGDAPAGPMQVLTIRSGYNADEALEALRLFPEIKGIHVHLVDIDPKLFGAMRRLKPPLYVVPPDADIVDAYVAMNKESQVTIQRGHGSNVDDLLITLASEQIPVTQINWNADEASRKGCVAAGAIPTLWNASFTDVDDSSMASFRNHRRLRRIVLLRSPDCGNATADVISTMSALTYVHLDGTSIDDEGLAKIGEVPHLAGFHWSNAGISANGLAMVGANKKQFEYLEIESPALGDDHLVAIRDWPLVELKLVGGKFTADGMKNLACVRQTLRLIGCEVDVDAMQALGRSLTTPVIVELESSSINDNGLEWLADLPGLEALSLRKCNVTSVTIERLAASKSLRFLKLGGEAFDASSLSAINSLHRLEVLHLIGSSVTDAALATASSATVKDLYLEDTLVTTGAIPQWLATWPKLERVHILHRGTPTSISLNDVYDASKSYPGIVYPDGKPSMVLSKEPRSLWFLFQDLRPQR